MMYDNKQYKPQRQGEHGEHGVGSMIDAFASLKHELSQVKQDINSEVLNLVKEMCGANKLILVVSHEAVQGIFDEQIDLVKKD